MTPVTLLAIDVGNTNTAFGLFKGRRLLRQWNRPTHCLKRGYGAQYSWAKKADAAIIASVVPRATVPLVRWCTTVCTTTPLIAGTTVVVPIINRYRQPKQVGQDRLVNAYAAVMLYGTPAVIIDFGTATTIDVVSGKGAYLGGLIVPGLTMSLEALHARTALLPLSALAPSKELIGRDTRESILSGVVRGTALLIEAATLRLQRILGRRTTVIATGGDARLMARYCRVIDVLDDRLTLKGLQLTYHATQEKR